MTKKNGDESHVLSNPIESFTSSDKWSKYHIYEGGQHDFGQQFAIWECLFCD